VADNTATLQLVVTGNAEAEIKKVASSLTKLDSDSKTSLAGLQKNLESAFSIFTKAAIVTGGIFAIKEALDLVFDAEKIKATNQQFEILAANVGISADALKEGLVAASHGLVDDTDLVGLANKGIIELGSNAKRLPEVMELARKAAAGFGGTVVERFEEINQAIATGNTRTIKQIGLTVDADGAYRKLASSLGVGVDELSQFAKQQALMNAVLEKGGSQYANINTEITENTNTYRQLKVTLAQIGETAILAFDRLAGPAVREALKFMSIAAKDAGNFLTSQLGSGAEKAQLKVNDLTDTITRIRAVMSDLESKKLSGIIDPEAEAALKSAPQQVAFYEAELIKAKEQLDQYKSKQEAATGANNAAKESLINLEAQQQKLIEQGKQVAERVQVEDPNAKYEKDLEALTAYYLSSENLKLDYEAALDQLEKDRDKKHEELISKEISDLNSKNEALLRLDAEANAAEIQTNKDKITAILELEDKSSVAFLKQKKYEAEQELKIKQDTAGAVSGILGNMAVTAKAFGQEGFEVYKALAEAQALVNTYSSAVAAYSSTVGIPFIGPALAPIAAAAAVAAGLANVAQINATHLASGIDSVPAGYEDDSFPAFLKTNERVVDSNTNQDLKGFLRGDGPMIGLLASINDRLSKLENQIVVNIGGREIINEIRSSLNAGRSFT
jgi:hypothetical protein